MPTDTWNPTQYERFRVERAQPYFDLLALVRPKPEMRAIDLGCGTGELSRELHRRLETKQTLGVDSSAAMLAKSAAYAGNGVSFVLHDIRDLPSEPRYDLVFSNATLQWLPDHPGLFRRLTGMLLPGGQLAVQVPANHTHPSHTVVDELASEPPFREALGGYRWGKPVLEPEQYAELLYKLGFQEHHVRLQVYSHVLPSREGVFEWMKGTLLTGFEARLPALLFARFAALYRDRLMTCLSNERPYLFTFRRILIWGMLPLAAA